MLKQLRTAVFPVVIFIAAVFFVMLAVCDNRTPDFATPISLKVKMNN